MTACLDACVNAALGCALLIATSPVNAHAARSGPSDKTTTRSVRAAATALASGHYEDARRLAIASARGRSGDAAADLVAARAEMALGLYDPARERLERAAEGAPHDLPLRRALCEVLALRGDRAGLKPLLDLTYDDWNAHRADIKSAEDLLAIAAIVRLDDNWQDANDTLRAAVRADPKDPRPTVFWGTLFLEKYAVTDAETSFQAALAIDPNNADAHVGLATVELRKRYDVAVADKELGAALRTNPRHAGALAVRAEMAIDGESFDVAGQILADLRRTNPHDSAAAWLAAARAWLLDDNAGYRRERDAHAAIHPADGTFFAEVADILVRHRRIESARAVAEECTAIDAQNAHCQSVLATILLRLGDDDSGVAALRRAWKRDPYDARTYNLLDLYEKVVPGMQTFTTGHLTFRVDPQAHVAVERVVAPFLEETYARYAAKYGFQPTGSIRFELFTNPDHFAIRTVGLPGIGVEAVCFGRVITSQSPTNGTMNWGMVLAHELAHVFAIELSRSRVPRWFTEGLSELETMRIRPEWTRHAERNLWGAMKRGELATLSELSNAFVRARDSDEATRAYAEAAAALDYLDRRFGFARIRSALVGFGAGGRGLSVVASAMGVSIEALEQGFRADLLARTAAFDSQYLPAETLRLPRDAAMEEPTVTKRGDEAALEQRANRWVSLGLTHLRRGDTAAATRARESAQAVPHSANRRAVLFLTGELALALRNADDARQAFLALLALPADDPGGGGDGYDVRVRLALAEIHRGDLPAAEEHLKRAIAFDAGSAEATGLMVELLGDPAWKGSRVEDRLRAIGATLRLEPLHANLAEEWVFGLARRDWTAAIVDAAPLAIFIDPGVPALHFAYGRALAASGQSAAATEALERALALGPPRSDMLQIRELLGTLRSGAKTKAKAAPQN